MLLVASVTHSCGQFILVAPVVECDKKSVLQKVASQMDKVNFHKGPLFHLWDVVRMKVNVGKSSPPQQNRSSTIYSPQTPRSVNFHSHDPCPTLWPPLLP